VFFISRVPRSSRVSRDLEKILSRFLFFFVAASGVGCKVCSVGGKTEGFGFAVGWGVNGFMNFLCLVMKAVDAGEIAFRDQFGLGFQPMLHFVTRE
jgi:hypothetical protein